MNKIYDIESSHYCQLTALIRLGVLSMDLSIHQQTGAPGGPSASLEMEEVC